MKISVITIIFDVTFSETEEKQNDLNLTSPIYSEASQGSTTDTVSINSSIDIDSIDLEIASGSQSEIEGQTGAPVKSTIEDLKSYLNKNCKKTLKKYDTHKTFTDNERREIIRFIVKCMVYKYGPYPKKKEIIDFAEASTTIFPTYRNENSTVPYSFFYHPECNTGYLYYGLKYFQKKYRTTEGCKNKKRKIQQANQEENYSEEHIAQIENDVQFLSNAVVALQKEEIIKRHKRTHAYRKSLPDDQKLKKFPRYLDCPELVNIDFTLDYPETEKKLIDEWENLSKAIPLVYSDCFGNDTYVVDATIHFSRSEEERYFSRSPKNVDVVAGRNVTLPCEVTPGHNIKYYWELNGHAISNTTRRFQQGSDLVITRADRERDSGHFTCIAHDVKSGLSITSSEAALNIHWIGEASVQLQAPESASYITPGSDVTLRCHLDASGDIRYEWFRNADRLTKTSRLDVKKKRLHIKSVNPSDNGVYRCSAFNEAGSVHSVKNFALAVSGDQTALIQTVPINQLVKKGSSAQFDCVYQQSNVLEWYFKDRPVESNDRISVLSNGTLQISDVRESDQGIYNCVGIRAESTEVPQSYIAELKVAFLDNLTVNSFEPSLPDDQTRIVSEGSLFQQSCLQPYSLPPARQWWLNPAGHTISDTGSTRVDDGRLIIDKTESKDAGTYTCVAENMAGKTEMPVTVVVTTKPEITLDPESVTVDENKKSVLTCGFNAMDEPFTTVRWRKDGKELRTDHESGNGHHKIKNNGNSSSLVIHSTKISDRGEFKCEVHTLGFEPILSKPATISVIEILKFSPPPVSKNLELGSIAKVHCKAQGTPPPLVHWERYPNLSDGFASHITDMNGTLHFNGVLSDDKGKYICYATNSQGTINTTVNIEIVVAPKFVVFPKNSVEAIEGYSVMIDCIVEGDPKPMIQWDKNSRMNDFDNSRFKVLENGTLFISEVYRDDDNKYGCTAGNSAGLNRKEVRLVVHSGEGYRPNENSEDLENEGAMITKAVLITMSVAGAYMILVIGLMVWCRYRRKARKLADNTEAGKTEPVETDNTELKDNVNGHVAGPSKPTENGVDAIHKEGQKSDGGDTVNSHSSGHSKKSKSSYDKISLSRQLLKEIKQIGRGEFGDIMIAKMAVTAPEKRNSTAVTPTGTSEEKEVPVLVKSLTQTKDEECLAEFKRELDLFHKINHENVAKLLGLCREVEPHYLILEHTDWGDFKQFLQATQKDGPTPELTLAQAGAVIHQLAKGMEHLSNNRLVHKDLAARNCVITSSLRAKVSMPRLIKEPYSQEYCKHMNQLIPLRWLPYEAVYEDDYSTKSDVYAFGVLIWEIFSKGELPLSKMSDNTLLTQLKEKQVQWKAHKATPTELLKLQDTCWAQSPKDRPYFTDIVQTVTEILKSL